MDNQHKKIKGYRDLSQVEIDLMNKIKEKGSELGDIVSQLEELSANTGGIGGNTIDARWLYIGKADLQKGLMALVRSVAQPGGF